MPDRFFDSDEPVPRRYFYRVDSWVREQEWPKRRKRIKESQLPEVDFMVIEVKPADPKEQDSFITVWGPFDDYDFIEGILSYDYGDEGSRVYPVAA